MIGATLERFGIIHDWTHHPLRNSIVGIMIAQNFIYDRSLVGFTNLRVDRLQRLLVVDMVNLSFRLINLHFYFLI
jgi:hypothetical protein